MKKPCGICGEPRIVLYRRGELLLCRRCYIREQEDAKRRHMK